MVALMQSTLVLIQIISLPINTCFDEPTFFISFLIKKQIVIYNEINLKFPFKLKVLRKMTSAAQDLRRSKKSALMNNSREIQKKSSLFCLFARLKLFFPWSAKASWFYHMWPAIAFVICIHHFTSFKCSESIALIILETVLASSVKPTTVIRSMYWNRQHEYTKHNFIVGKILTGTLLLNNWLKLGCNKTTIYIAVMYNLMYLVHGLKTMKGN